MTSLFSRDPGSVLDGKYEIVETMGSGGMGEVYLVRHLHLQELRVVKILRQDLAADPVAQKRFVREARLATQIKHPNVAILYDFSRLPDGSFYMVWEYIKGRDVGDWIKERGPFPVPVAIQLGIQALRGLEAIHASGIVHRDLSPDNLMLTENARGQSWIKIIDLGLAKNLNVDSSLEITQVGMFMGKLRYCSPEQASSASGETLDRRSDIYSFALVLYEMITGMPAFDSDNTHGFIFKRLSEDPVPLVGRNPQVAVPAGLDLVVRRGLARDREQRYPDAIGFLEALDRVQQALTSVETQEVPIGGGAPRAVPPSAPTPMPQARVRSASELSREERLDLLAQIDRAARRVHESGAEITKVEAAIAAGRLGEAREAFGHLEVANPRTPGLDRLKERLTDAERGAAADRKRRAAETEQATSRLQSQADSALAAGQIDAARQIASQIAALDPKAPGLDPLTARLASAGATADLARRVGEAERVLDKYLQKKQLALARLALETLLEIAPQHPNRTDYESWVGLLEAEIEQDRRADVALAAGRAAITRRDFKGARRELATVTRNDVAGQRSEALSTELDAAERGLHQGAELEQRRKRLEELLAARKVAAAEPELERLAALGVARVTLDSYRERLNEVRAEVEAEGRLAPLEKRYREKREARDWFAAREVAQELEQTFPGHSRSAAMFAEVERLESIHKKQQSVEQGVHQVEAFIAKGDTAMAQLALKILLQLDPENRHKKRLEKQIRGM